MESEEEEELQSDCSCGGPPMSDSGTIVDSILDDIMDMESEEEFPAVQAVVEEEHVVESVEENEFPPMAESGTIVHGVIDDIVAEVMNNIEESLPKKSEDELGGPRRSERLRFKIKRNLM